MIKGFIYDGERFELSEMENLPYPKGYLKAVAKERVWSGKPSVTQLSKGGMYHYLNKVNDRYVDPDEMTFALMGTAIHRKLEDNEPDSISEFAFATDRLTGIIDEIDIDANGQISVWDYKTSGTYSVLKFLGMDRIDVPSLDDEGNEQYFKSGARKGELKTHKEWVQLDRPAEYDIYDYYFQLYTYADIVCGLLKSVNDWLDGDFTADTEKISKYIGRNEDIKKKYFIDMAEKWNGEFPQMGIMFVPRDGGMKSAINHGTDKRSYVVEIPFEQERYDTFKEIRNVKIDEITKINEEDYYPKEGCNKLETKNGGMCERYCPFRTICAKKYGVDNEG